MAHQELPSNKTEQEIKTYNKARRKIFANRLIESGGKTAAVGIVGSALILATAVSVTLTAVPLGFLAAIGLAGYGVARAAEGGIRQLKRG